VGCQRFLHDRTPKRPSSGVDGILTVNLSTTPNHRTAHAERRQKPTLCRGYCGCQGGADALMCRADHPGALTCEACDSLWWLKRVEGIAPRAAKRLFVNGRLEPLAVPQLNMQLERAEWIREAFEAARARPKA
jgi:hypothetical protein